MQLRDIIVIKSGNEREPFDRAKIEHSVALACRKRGIEQERLDQLVSGIQRQIETLGDSEISSTEIGEMVMDGLRQLDSVAYIRFAWVYRDFSRSARFRGICQHRARCRQGELNRPSSSSSARNWARISARRRGRCSISG